MAEGTAKDKDNMENDQEEVVIWECEARRAPWEYVKKTYDEYLRPATPHEN